MPRQLRLRTMRKRSRLSSRFWKGYSLTYYPKAFLTTSSSTGGSASEKSSEPRIVQVQARPGFSAFYVMQPASTSERWRTQTVSSQDFREVKLLLEAIVPRSSAKYLSAGVGLGWGRISWDAVGVAIPAQSGYCRLLFLSQAIY